MQRHYPQPVVIGSGLTGLLISIALSKANIEHILIGGPPPSGSPRLGESLNLEATLYFLAEFPELADCYYGKEFAYIYGMDRTGIFDFSFLQDIQTRSFLSLMGKQAPPGLIHFDRVILDAAVYEKAVCSPYCTQLETRVTQINWSANANSIQQIVLQDGDVLPVSHVFDATGYVRLVARQLGIQRQMLGKTQHVVYAHYFRSASASDKSVDAPWRHGTNIMRLYEGIHGIDALAWCIPLGDKISIGVTTPNGPTLPADEMILECVLAAFAGRGIHFVDEYEDRSRAATAKMEFYTHACSYGANWLLASAAFMQVWWPTSAGMDTSVAAAQVAVPFLTQPAAVGRRYQWYLEPLVRSQHTWNWMSSHQPDEVTNHSARRFADRLFWSITHRNLRGFMLEDRDPLSLSALSLVERVYGNEIIARLPTPASVEQVGA